MRLPHRCLAASVLFLGACARLQPSPEAARTPERDPTSLPTPGTPTPLVSRLDEKAPQWLTEHEVPSVAVAYVRDGAVEWTRVYGEQAEGVPATSRTLYNVASLAKPVFAETVLRLAADGRLSLDEPFAPHWIDPDVAGDPRHEALTPRIALSHRTGFPNWRYQTQAVLAFGFAPGTSTAYSGEGYEYTRRFVQKKLGASWEALSRQYLLEPLGMRSTAFTEQDWFAGRVAHPKGPEGEYGEPSFQSTPSAADDVYTTIDDYGAFLAGVMSRRGLPAAIAAQRDSLHPIESSEGAACDAERVTQCPERIGFGLGWFVLEYPQETVLWHTGGDWGERAMVFYFPERKEGMVILANGANGIGIIMKVIGLYFRDTHFAEFLASKG